MAERKVEATLRAYEPSLKERLYQTLAGTEQRPTAERASFARGLSDLAEFMPFLGNVLAGEEAYRRGDNKGLAMAMLPLTGARAPHRVPFDENMFQAYLRGRYRLNAPRGVGPVVGEGGEDTARMMGMGYSAEDLGQAVAPYRQGGLVYEPVGPQAGPHGPLEGEFADVYGIAGPRPYAGGMDFGVTREGMAAPPSGMMFDPRIAAGAAGLGYLAGLPNERQTMAAAGGVSPRGAVQLPPIDVFGPRGATTLSGDQGPGTVFEAPASPRRAPAKPKAKGGGKAKTPSAPREEQAAGGWDPNLNYLVTQAIDQLLGQREAERGREYQQYYERNPL